MLIKQKSNQMNALFNFGSQENKKSTAASVNTLGMPSSSSLSVAVAGTGTGTGTGVHDNGVSTGTRVLSMTGMTASKSSLKLNSFNDYMEK